VCFAKCVLLQLLVLPITTSLVCCGIHFGKFFFFLGPMVVAVKEARLVVTVKSPHIKMHEQLL
jgi:hypothetical protein